MGRFVGGYGVIDIVDQVQAVSISQMMTERGPSPLSFLKRSVTTAKPSSIRGLAARRPSHVLSMFGRCGLLGAGEALAPGTYFMGSVLIMHRTLLDWLSQAVPAPQSSRLTWHPGRW